MRAQLFGLDCSQNGNLMIACLFFYLILPKKTKTKTTLLVPEQKVI